MSGPEQLPLLNEPEQAPSSLARPDQVGAAKVDYVSVRDALTKATGFMDAYDFTLNPYAGCTFGCTYCYAAFFSRSPQRRDSWGSWVSVKENLVEQLRRRRPGALDGKRIYMSSVTDPYQPIERRLKLTQGLLEVLAARHRVKLVVQTRSPDVVRDRELLAVIGASGGQVQVNRTVTTDDEDVRRTFEPSCPSNGARLQAMSKLAALGADQGVGACITMTPLLLVQDASAFAETLSDTGVRDFIIQPFHFQRGKFVAGTRDEALRLIAEKLAASSGTFRKEYLRHYEEVAELLRCALPRLGEGKAGFAPPF